MTTRTKGIAALLLAGLIAGALVFWGRSSEGGTDSAAQPTQHRFGWKPGWVYRYDVTLSSDNTTRPAQSGQSGRTLLDPMSAAFDLDARVELRIHRRHEGGYLAGLAFSTCRRAHLEAGGQVLLEGAKACLSAVEERELLLRVDARGRIAGVYEDEAGEGDALFPHLARSVAAAMNLSLGDGEQWQASERTLHGEARSVYRVSGQEVGDRTAFTRTRHTYEDIRALEATETADLVTDVDASHRLVVHPEGYLLSLEGRERIVVDAPEGRIVDAVDAVKLTFHSMASLHRRAPSVASRTLRGLGDPPPNGVSDRQRMERRAEGLTADQARRMLVAYGPSGVLPDHNRSLVRLHALLHLEPELAGELAQLATRAEATPELRALVLDLLAQAGHAEAQAALRDTLRATQGDPHRYTYLQRAALLHDPEPETIALLEQVADGAGDEGTAALYTLGTLARRVGERGDAEGRRRVLHRIERALEVADDPDERSHALVALANAAHEDALPHFERALDADDPEVRRAGLIGLTHLDGEPARRLLAEAVADDASSVQAAALHALAEVGATATDLEEVAHRLHSGGLRSENVGALVNLLSRSRATAPELTRELATTVLAGTTVRNPALRAALERLARG